VLILNPAWKYQSYDWRFGDNRSGNRCSQGRSFPFGELREGPDSGIIGMIGWMDCGKNRHPVVGANDDSIKKDRKIHGLISSRLGSRKAKPNKGVVIATPSKGFFAAQ
jgi:hypothetical protein